VNETARFLFYSSRQLLQKVETHRMPSNRGTARDNATQAADDLFLTANGNQKSVMLFLASFLALFFELLVIRYLSTEIRVFGYLKNLSLIGCFLGIGLGMIYGRRDKVERLFPWAILALFALIRFAPTLHLTHVGYLDYNYVLLGIKGYDGVQQIFSLARYLVVTLGILSLITVTFVTIGGLVGEYLKSFQPLRGYGINLAGSLAGILLFTFLAFFSTPPFVWLLLGCFLLVSFFWRKPIVVAALVCIVLMHVMPQKNTYWSPYYRVDLLPLTPPTGSTETAAYLLSVNHDYHQQVVDLSPGFISKYPDAEPNHGALASYELPYFFVPNPARVLIVGAGTGNDVAAALRHGAGHVDAVEIDRVIQELGRKYHPEHPYDSPRVSIYIDDARAFFSKAPDKYDLIVFGYLDSHTMFSSFTSLRLDNYVYTVQSFQAARRLLKPDGTLVLAFGGGAPFANERQYAMLEAAFGQPPAALNTGYAVTGNVFIEGPNQNLAHNLPFPDIGNSLKRPNPLMATDSWPFVYLAQRTIPGSLLILLAYVVLGAHWLLRSSLGPGWTDNTEYRQMFFLGAAFMLLETKCVTHLSLLFGSTWIVNSLVIGSFLTMGFLANLWAMFRPVSPRLTYALLFISLLLGLLISPVHFIASSATLKVIAAGLLVGIPVFFSGIVFSNSFRVVAHPEKALAVNLFGAMAGGILENTVMLGGINLLGVLAILLYSAAMYFSLARTQEAQLVPELSQ
jgi:SAM-dependent methyltransferase